MVFENPLTYCNTCPPPTSNSSYYIRSSILGGQPVAVVNQQAETKWRYVYANGELIASSGNGYVGYSGFEWRHNAPSGIGVLRTYSSFGNNGIVDRTELDPVRDDVGTENPYTGGGNPGGSPNSSDLTSRFADAHDFTRCSRDEMLMPCDMIFREGYEDTIDGIGHERRFVPIRYRDKDYPTKIRYGLGSRKRLRNGKWAYVPVGKVQWESDEYVVFRFPGGATGGGYVTLASAPMELIQETLLAQLEPSKILAINNALSYISTRLKNGAFSEICNKKVLGLLTSIPGFDLQRFKDFLDKGGQFYDGTKSEDLYAPHLAEASVRSRYPDLTIAKYFKNVEGVDAMVSGTSPGYVVFFRPNAIDRGGDVIGVNRGNLALQFHEALHGYGVANNLRVDGDKSGALSDAGLQDLFGLTVGAASQNITEYIKKYCF